MGIFTKVESKRSLAAVALLFSMVALSHGDPIVIAPTTNTGLGTTLTSGLYGSIYNFSAADPTTSDYTVSNILNSTSTFDTVKVGSYIANTSAGITYGTPSSADSQPLTTWLNGDGASVVYSAPHITSVFDSGTDTGTFIVLTGYITVTPAMVNVPQTYSMALDDGGSLTINGTSVIDNGGIHGATVIPQTVIFTRAGLYPITIGYYDGHATQAVLDAVFGGGTIATTPNGTLLVAAPPIDSTANTVLTYVNKVSGTFPSDPTFNNAANALANLALSGNIPGYQNALKELSPLKYAALTTQTSSTIDFITNDLDDYLAHRRTDAGTFRPGNGIDLSGMSVFNGNMDPGLQEIASHLLAYTGDTRAANEMSDTPNPVLDPAGRTSSNQHWNVFTRGIVVLSQNFSSPGIQHSDATVGTLQFGADYQISPHFLVGAYFNYAHSSGSLDGEGSTASANSYIPGLYASYTEDGWYANALTAGGVSDYDVTRNIVFPGFDASAQASPQGEEEYSYISGGHDFHIQNWTLGPTAGLQYVHTNTDEFTENGAGLLDLDVSQHESDSLRSRLGGRVYYAGSYGNVVWRPFLDASWQHEFMLNNNSLTSQFDGAGVGTFTVTAPSNSRESALISVGADIDIDKNTDVFTAYRMEAGASNFFAQSVEAGVKVTF